MPDIHIDDERAIQFILGKDEIPGHILDEYAQWQAMYSRAGMSGRLGPLVIAMLQHMGVKVKVSAPIVSQINWRHVERGVRVKAFCDGIEYRGEFAGCGSMGGVIVAVDDDPVLREFTSIEVTYEGSTQPQLAKSKNQSSEKSELFSSEEMKEISEEAAKEETKDKKQNVPAKQKTSAA